MIAGQSFNWLEAIALTFLIGVLYLGTVGTLLNLPRIMKGLFQAAHLVAGGFRTALAALNFHPQPAGRKRVLPF